MMHSKAQEILAGIAATSWDQVSAVLTSMETMPKEDVRKIAIIIGLVPKGSRKAMIKDIGDWAISRIRAANKIPRIADIF